MSECRTHIIETPAVTPSDLLAKVLILDEVVLHHGWDDETANAKWRDPLIRSLREGLARLAGEAAST